MADQSSNVPSPNPSQNHTNKPISSFLGSPRFFNRLLTRSLSDTETIKTSRDRLYDTEPVTSPNSILDGMQSLNLRNPFGYDRKSPNPISKKPPTINTTTTTKNTPQFQTSGGRLHDTEIVTSPNMQNLNLGTPFGYDRKSPKPISKEPPTIKTTTEITPQFQTSGGRLHDTETVTNPNMQNLNLGNPFGYDRKPPNPITKEHSNNKMESESIGLALIDPKESTINGSSSKDYNRMVLFGAKLKVEIPCSIESSEDYTCVITHGPNPKTTHIFDNCIIESCCGVRKLSELTKESSCKVDHIEGKDI